MSSRGQVLVEFALAVPLLLVAFLGGWFIVLVAAAQVDVQNAATAGARVLAQTADPQLAAGAAQAASRYGSGLRVSAKVSGVGARRTADVEVAVDLPAPLRALFGARVSATASRQVEARP